MQCCILIHKCNCITLEGYVEHMAHCITSCPQGLLSVNGVCKECIGECPEGMAVAIMYNNNNAF